MKPKQTLLSGVLLLLFILFALPFVANSQATLTTDSADYHPGSTVVISGSSFSPGETVSLQVTHLLGGNNQTGSAHAPWSVIADQSGNINAKWLVPTDEDELGASLKLTANGTSSLVNAESFFTDAVITVTTANVSWKSLSITASDLVVIKGGGSLVVDVTDAQCASIKIAGASSDGAVGNAGAGTLIFNTGSQLTVSGTVTVGAIEGSSYVGTLNMTNGGKLICGGFVKSGFKVEVLIPGTGTIELNATNSLLQDFKTFNNLTIAAGTTSLQAATTATGLLTVMGGAVLDLFSRDFTVNSLAGSGTITDTAIPGVNYNSLIVGADNSSSTFSGLISDGAVQGRQRLWKKGTGTLTLPNANTYGGFTSLWAGTTEIGNNSAFGTGIAILSTNASSATLIALGGARTINNEIWLAGTTIIGGTNDFVLNGKVTISSGDKTLKLTNTGTTTLAGKIALSEDPTVAHRLTITGTGNVVIDGPIADCDGNGSAGSVIFDKSFTGKAVINGSNTYSKYTSLTNGTFVVSNKNVFGTGAIYLTNPSISATTELTGINSFTNPVTNFAHPVFTGTKSIEFSERWINIASDTLTNNISEGMLSITDTVDLSNSSTNYSFMFDGAGTTSITGLIENGPSTASNVIYSGTGILILVNSANKYTGSTTINAGELRINPNTGSATFASRMVLNGGRLSTANIASNVSWVSTSTLALSSNSSIDLGSNPHSLKFADSRLAIWSASTLTINGWTGLGGSAGTGGRIFFGNNATGLTAAQLAKIHFTGYDGPSILLSTGELVPTMLCTAPVINTTPNGQPANASISYGDNTSFSVAATGGGTLAYNWRISKDGGSTFTNITDESFPGYTGATSNSLSLAKPTVVMSDYQYQCVIINGCGTVTSSAGMLTVNPRELTVSIAAADKEYDGNTNAEVTAISPITGLISGDDLKATASNGSFVSKTAGIGKTVTADISLNGTDAANYVFNPKASVIANIRPKPLDIQISASSRVYDGTKNAIVQIQNPLIGVIEGDDVTAGATNGVFDNKDVGVSKRVTADVSLSGADANNYILGVSASAVADIFPLEISGSFTADDKIYDGDVTAKILARSLSGAIPEDDVSLSGGTAYFEDRNVADKKLVTLTGATLAGQASGNYSLTGVSTTTASIRQRPITIQVINKRKTYGELDPEYISEVVSGSVFENDFPSGSVLRETGENVGEYRITQGTYTYGSNYLETFIPGSLTIVPLEVTVSAFAKTKAYGDIDPAFTYTSSPAVGTVLPNKEVVAFNGQLSRVDGETVPGSPYHIEQGSLFNSNYTIRYTGADLTIEPAKVTVKVDDKSKDYGAALPELTGSITGIKEFDGISVSFTTVATEMSDVVPSGYPITANLNDPNGKLSNYSVNYLPGVLMIKKANPIIAVVGFDGKYDGSQHGAISTSAKGLNNVDLSTLLHLESTTYTYVPGGTLHWDFEGNNNYNSMSGEATVNIKKADAVIQVQGYDVTYDGNTHVAAAKALGVESPAADLSGLLDLSGTAHTDAGDYKLDDWIFAGNENYNAAKGTVHSTISKAASTVTVAVNDFIYDGDRHPASASVMGSVEVIQLLTISYSGVGATTYGPSNAAPINAGQYSASAVYAGDDNHTGSSDSKTFTIGKAPTTTAVTISGGPFRYTGSEITTATVSVTGADLSLAPAPDYANNVNAGTATASYSYAGDDNHTGSSDSKTFTIGKANAVVSVTPYKVTYDGTEHTAAFTAVGVESTPVNLASLMDVTNTKHTGAGDYAKDTWSFAGNDNYNAVSATTIEDKIDKASSTTVVTIVGGPFRYSGSEITPATVSVTGANLSLAPAADYANNVNAGTATASYSYAGDDNHTGSSDSKTFTIGKKQLTVTAQNKEKVYDGLNYVDGGGIFSATITGFAASEGLETSGVSGFPAYEGPAITAIHYGSHLITPTIGTLQADNYSFSFVNGTLQIIKRAVDISGSKVYNGNFLFTAADLIAGNLVGRDIVNLEGSVTVSSNKVGNYTSLATNSLSCLNPDYQATGGSIDLDITQRALKVTAAGVDKVYDGTTDAIVKLSSDKLASDDVSLSCTASFVDPNAGTWEVMVNGISIAGSSAGNYGLVNSTCVTAARITKAPTTTVLTISAAVVRYMDQVTLTARITPSNKASELTGTVQFKIGSVLYGSPVTVVPIPNDPSGAVQATFVGQVTNLPTTSYAVDAMFTSTNLNYSNSIDTKPLQVNQRNADPYNVNLGFYTGDIFAWTTGQSTSTGTIRLSTTIKDNNILKGDVRAARVTFYLVNGSGMTPITGATNLPVGLVDISDGSVGTASAIVQMNIGSNNAQDFKVAVGIAGAYYNMASSALAQAIVTVSKPIPGGFMVCGGRTQNESSSGYLKGDVGLMTDFESDIVYTKSGTNPKGKADVLIRSHYKTDGTLDTKQHMYVITTNAIVSLNVIGGAPATATFSSKANLYEQTDVSLVLIEGGAVFEMVVKQGCEQEVAITLYRKAGGIWFSNNWNGTSTAAQRLYDGKASVVGAKTCSTTVASKVIVRQEVTDETKKVLAPDVRVYPNPATSQFNVKLESANRIDAINILVYSANGRVIEQRTNLSAEQTIQLGALYRPGVYILEIIQGTERKRMKLIKIPD